MNVNVNTNNNPMVAAGGKNRDNNKNAKKDVNKVEKTKTVEWITQYFQDNQIKEINLVGNELVVTKNNNEIVSSKNNQELQNIENQLGKTIKLGELQSLLINNNSSVPSSSPTDSNNTLTHYSIGCIIGGTLIMGMIIGYLLRKKAQQK